MRFRSVFRTLGQDADAPFRSFTDGFCEVAQRDISEGCVPVGAINVVCSRRLSGRISYGFSFRQLLHSCKKPIVSDNGAVDAAVIETDLFRDRKFRFLAGHALSGASDTTFAFLKSRLLG